jgi:hypothetical protein
MVKELHHRATPATRRVSGRAHYACGKGFILLSLATCWRRATIELRGGGVAGQYCYFARSACTSAPWPVGVECFFLHLFHCFLCVLSPDLDATPYLFYAVTTRGVSGRARRSSFCDFFTGSTSKSWPAGYRRGIAGQVAVPGRPCLGSRDLDRPRRSCAIRYPPAPAFTPSGVGLPRQGASPAPTASTRFAPCRCARLRPEPT